MFGTGIAEPITPRARLAGLVTILVEVFLDRITQPIRCEPSLTSLVAVIIEMFFYFASEPIATLLSGSHVVSSSKCGFQRRQDSWLPSSLAATAATLTLVWIR
jgi:hypothetical protein